MHQRQWSFKWGKLRKRVSTRSFYTLPLVELSASRQVTGSQNLFCSHFFLLSSAELRKCDVVVCKEA
jgi:hypothetical protein